MLHVAIRDFDDSSTSRRWRSGCTALQAIDDAFEGPFLWRSAARKNPQKRLHASGLYRYEASSEASVLLSHSPQGAPGFRGSLAECKALDPFCRIFIGGQQNPGYPYLSHAPQRYKLLYAALEQ